MENLPRITIQMEGLVQEGGHLRLNDFLRRLEDWKRILNQIDHFSPEGERADVYYRVVDLSHSSPATITLEAVPIKRKKKPVSSAAMNSRPRRLVQAMKSIRGKGEAPDIDAETLVAMKSVVPSESNGISMARISFGSSSVDLDQDFTRNLNSLIEGEEVAFGSVEGKLEALNIHGPRYSCVIYPEIGPQKVHCSFSVLRKAEVIAAIGKFVRVTGRKHYRAKSQFPYLIDLKEMESLPQSAVVKLSSLEGALNGSHYISSPQDLRDEW